MATHELESLFARYRRDGDVAALSEVFDRTSPDLLRLARSVMGKGQEAEDVVQDTFLTAIEVAATWDAARGLLPWLMGILVNEARNSRRRLARRPDPGRMGIGAVANPADEASAREFAVELDKALETLPAVYREVLAKRIQQGKKGDEIARDLGRPAGTVRTQMVRGLELMRRALPRGLATAVIVGFSGRRALARIRTLVLRDASTRLGVKTEVAGFGGVSASLATVLVTIFMAAVAWIFAKEDRRPRTDVLVSAVAKDPGSRPSEGGGARLVRRAERLQDRGVGRDLATLVGRVVDERGAPVADVEVELLGASRHALSPSLAEAFQGAGAPLDLEQGQTRTDVDGRFRFGGLDPDLIACLIISAPDRGAFLRVLDTGLTPHRETVFPDIRLRPTAVLRGRVTDVEGVPVAGARVRASDLPSMALAVGLADFQGEGAVALAEEEADGRRSNWCAYLIPRIARDLWRRLPWSEGVTDVDGAFQIDGVPHGLTSISILHPQFVSVTAGPFATGERREVDVGEVTIDRGVSLHGRMVDDRGDPLADRAVFLGAVPPLIPMCVLSRCLRTDEEGRFVVDALRSTGHLVAIAGAQGAGFEYFDDVVPGGAERVFRARSARAVDFLVTGDDDQPIADPDVRLRVAASPSSSSLFLPMTRLASARAGGLMRVWLPGDGDMVVAVGAPGYGLAWFPIGTAAATSSPAEVRLTRAHEHRVSCVDEETGAPVVGAWVGLMPRAASSFDLVGAHVLASSITDAAGTARVPCTDHAATVIRVESAAHAPTAVDPREPGEEIHIALGAGATLCGQLCQVPDSASEEPRGWLVIARSSLVSTLRYTRADDAGSFRFDRLPPGACEVSVYPAIAEGRLDELYRFVSGGAAPRWVGQVDLVSGDERALRARLAASESLGAFGTIEGQILVEGAPGAGLRVTVSPAEAGPDLVTDASATGRFIVPSVPAGAVLVRVRETESLFSPIGRILASQRIVVGGGDREEVHFDVRTGRLRGRVVDGVGQPIAFAGVRLRSGGEGIPYHGLGRTSAYGTTDAGGRFVLERVPVGSYRLKVGKAGYAEASLGPVVIPDHGDAAETLVVLLPGVLITGTVVGHGIGDGIANGSPQDAAVRSIILRHDGDFVDRWATVDPETGGFEASGVAPGMVRILPGVGSARFDPVALVVPGQGLRSIRIEARGVP